MKYDLSILLVLRKAQLDKKGYAPLYIRITVNGKRSELSVNRKVEPQKWDSRLQRMIGRSESARVLNDYLDGLVNNVKKSFNELQEKGHQITAPLLRDIIVGKHKKKHSLLDVFGENNKLICKSSA